MRVFVDHVHIVVVVVVVRAVFGLRSSQSLAPQHDEQVERHVVLPLWLVVPVHDTGEGSRSSQSHDDLDQRSGEGGGLPPQAVAVHVIVPPL